MSSSSFPDPDAELDLLTRMSLKQLMRLNFATDRKLKVTLSDTLNVVLASGARLDSIALWGKLNETKYTQLQTQQNFQSGYRRNLVVS